MSFAGSGRPGEKQKRILGGEKATVGKYSYQVHIYQHRFQRCLSAENLDLILPVGQLNTLQVAFLLLEEDPDDPEALLAEVFCGGALMDSQWIVSAAHCFYKEVAPFYFTNIAAIMTNLSFRA